MLRRRALNDVAAGPARPATGALKSTSGSRLICRSAVTTTGRGSVGPLGAAGVDDDGEPARRPDGTRMTSPSCSSSSDAAAAARCAPERSRASSDSRSDSARRSSAYSLKSPRWQVAASR